MKTNNRATRAARTLVAFFDVVYQTTTWNFQLKELKQPRRWRQQKPHKFAYLTMKNRIFARFARAFFIFWLFEDVLVLSTTWNDLFCRCVDNVSTWWQMFNFFFFYVPSAGSKFNSRIVRTHSSSITSLNNWKMIAETWSYIFRWRSCFRRRLVCFSSLFEVVLTTWTHNSKSLILYIKFYGALTVSF